ncbi:MgtC/SapB family protein [Staphylothermus hellenicus]|uniref:Membrane protein-like protein n=1 Tax=Staphylothermus hellenicus (strain DSM 12710 / JCM 10830 / BK20S6-10-b1 / P8) TaxID=591019 RepID=D7D9Y8_STAHD|nr:MgtC/SapB family protein [Staphylothermus hellenicus]ADI32584.1 membrane protein-like protein [Staphylothermus hellenicus DSM 12710]
MLFFNDPTTDFVFKIIISFLVGALIGLERERTRIVSIEKRSGDKKYSILPGIRSFGLLSLYGMIISYTSFNTSYPDIRIVLTFFMILIIFIVFVTYIYQRSIQARRTGITTYIVMSIALILGFLVGIDKVYEAIAASVFVTLILATKPSIQAFVKGITYKELLSGLELGLFVFVLGPFFLIQHPKIMDIDLSTFYILFIVILILSYFSYIAVKIKGSKALKYIAFLGGLVNSEAAVSNIANVLSEQDIHDKELINLMKKYTYLIITAMIIRNLVIFLILGYNFLEYIQLAYISLAILAAMTVPLTVSVKTLFFEREEYVRNLRVTIENPLTFNVALKVVLAYSTIFILGFIVASILPVEWLIIVSLIGGFVNAGATILTMLTLAGVESISTKFLGILIITSLAAGISNKVFFVKTIAKRKALVYASFESVSLSIISSIIAIILLILFAP